VREDVEPVLHETRDRIMATTIEATWGTGGPDVDHASLGREVPDTFAAQERTHPSSIEPFQAFNLRMARDSARNVSTAIDRGSAATFLARAPRLGLRPATACRLAKQLIDERRRPQTCGDDDDEPDVAAEEVVAAEDATA
jgi:hypothetical protein